MSSKYISPQEWKSRLQKKTRTQEVVEVPSQSCIEEGVVLGTGALIGHFCHIESGAVIGDGALIQSGAVIKEGAVIGKKAKIGANATIEAGVKVGDYSIVEPNTYLNRDLPPHCSASACETLIKELKTL
ncbi:MAG: hypothetical protein IE916_01690 [Epsilonproteobacteria bacterium]|nr:hypothetical protein [Campylobacterota bacterium]